MFSLAMAMMMQGPALDYTWIEDRAMLRAAWERCVHGRVVELGRDGAGAAQVASAAMEACLVDRERYEARVASITRDSGEVATKMAEADAAIHREAVHWVHVGRRELRE